MFYWRLIEKNNFLQSLDIDYLVLEFGFKLIDHARRVPAQIKEAFRTDDIGIAALATKVLQIGLGSGFSAVDQFKSDRLLGKINIHGHNAGLTPGLTPTIAV